MAMFNSWAHWLIEEPMVAHWFINCWPLLTFPEPDEEPPVVMVLPLRAAMFPSCAH